MEKTNWYKNNTKLWEVIRATLLWSLKSKKTKLSSGSKKEISGDIGNWTPDLSHAKGALYPWAISPQNKTSIHHQLASPVLIDTHHLNLWTFKHFCSSWDIPFPALSRRRRKLKKWKNPIEKIGFSFCGWIKCQSTHFFLLRRPLKNSWPLKTTQKSEYIFQLSNWLFFAPKKLMKFIFWRNLKNKGSNLLIIKT